MNVETGEVAKREVLARELTQRGRGGEVETLIKPIDTANLTSKAYAQLVATGRTQISRNSPCPCGSRKRFKRCCMKVRGE